jgi:hypothetical protein
MELDQSLNSYTSVSFYFFNGVFLGATRPIAIESICIVLCCGLRVLYGDLDKIKANRPVNRVYILIIRPDYGFEVKLSVQF